MPVCLIALRVNLMQHLMSVRRLYLCAGLVAACALRRMLPVTLIPLSACVWVRAGVLEFASHQQVHHAQCHAQTLVLRPDAAAVKS